MKAIKHIEILLVEDEPADHYLFKTYLKNIRVYSYSLTWIRTYDEALEQIRKKKFDIYFFDYRLGIYTGLDLIRECNEAGITAPIIILTGLGSTETDLKAMELGASDYMVKGEIDPNNLERTIRYSIEQKQMLSKLKASETKFRGIFENSYDVIYISDKEGNFLDVNHSAERLLGFSKEELLNINFFDLFYSQEDVDAFLESIYKTGSCSNFEITLKDKHGNKKYCSLTSVIQQTDEEEIYYQGIIHDLTYRKKAERDMLAAEKGALAAKIARMLAHEVRNPLTSINLAVEQLEYSIEDQSFVPFFEIIKRNSKRINALVTELLENSKPAELIEKPVPVKTFLTNTIELTKDRAKLKNIKIETDLKWNDEKIMADESKLSIAVLNIIMNAIEAVKENEGIIKITSGSRENACIISIEDNGCGIPEEQITKVFDPYFTSKPNGMGLGLASSQNIIQTHHGKIDIISEINKGTIFNIELKLADSQ